MSATYGPRSLQTWVPRMGNTRFWRLTFWRINIYVLKLNCNLIPGTYAVYLYQSCLLHRLWDSGGYYVLNTSIRTKMKSRKSEIRRKARCYQYTWYYIYSVLHQVSALYMGHAAVSWCTFPPRTPLCAACGGVNVQLAACPLFRWRIYFAAGEKKKKMCGPSFRHTGGKKMGSFVRRI